MKLEELEKRARKLVTKTEWVTVTYQDGHTKRLPWLEAFDLCLSQPDQVAACDAPLIDTLLYVAVRDPETHQITVVRDRRVGDG